MISRRDLFAGLSAGVLAVPQVSWAASATPRALTEGAVAAPDAYGAEAAREILAAGGNAVDATVAAAFALAVTYPEAGNLGGGGFMTLYMNGRPYFLDYRETAPGKATKDMYLDAQGEPVRRLSLVGNLSVATPGTVRGMAMAHRRFGKLPWSRLLAASIRLARDGFVVSPHLAGMRQGSEASFKEVANFDAYFADLKAGARLRQPELATTLERIAAEGDRAFYEGEIANLIVRQMSRGPVPGLITTADLAAYKAVWREPVQGRWRDFDVITSAPPSSGGIALLQMLTMKAQAADLFAGVAHNSPRYVHLVSEIAKRAFADRARYLADPDFVPVPIAALTDPAYLARRAREIDPNRPTPLGAVSAGLEPRQVSGNDQLQLAELERPQTTHVSIVDRWGNAVGNTYTLNGWFGSGVVVEGAGFLLNQEMDDFSAKPGAPNQLGVVSAGANAIAPGKRPLSSMSPTILVKDGKVAMVIGTPGGSRIFTSIFQVLVNVYDFGMPLETALAQPRFHHQLLPENTIFEEPFAPLPEALVRPLEMLGYQVQTQSFNGDIEAIQVVRGAPVPASDPRARGVSALAS